MSKKEKSLYPYIIGAYGNRTCGKVYIQKLIEENKQLKEENEKLSLIRNKALNWFACPDKNKLQNLLDILRGGSNE